VKFDEENPFETFRRLIQSRVKMAFSGTGLVKIQSLSTWFSSLLNETERLFKALAKSMPSVS